jgi:hypothetical protein
MWWTLLIAPKLFTDLPAEYQRDEQRTNPRTNERTNEPTNERTNERNATESDGR